MFPKAKHIHFIGVGGIGMSGIALLCLKRGYKISGSDVKPTRITEKLEREGVSIYIGHRKENIKGADFVVYSSAVTFQNPELKEAIFTSIPAWQRGVFLSEIMKGKAGIAVAGSHGKTTTSSLVATMINELGYNPTSVVGAIVERFSGNVLVGNGDYFIIEADESDGSFLSLNPHYGIITNIDAEHLDFYTDMEQILQAYIKFANNIQEKGTLICCHDDANIKKIIPEINTKKILTYGFDKKSTLYAAAVKLNKNEVAFKCFYKNRLLGNAELSIPGKHNVLNAMAAILLGLEMGIKFNDIKRAIFKYNGAERRFQIKASIDDILIVDDYAHHPTEIKATLEACRWFDKKRIIAVFQPHRYTRTKLLCNEFARCFDNTDFLILTDIYPASEAPIYGVTTKIIYDEMLKLRTTNVNYLAKEQIVDHLLKIIKKGDLLIILGAGDINKLADEIIERIKIKKEHPLKIAGKV